MDNLPPELISAIERGFRDIVETNREILKLIEVIEERRQQRTAKSERNTPIPLANGKSSLDTSRATKVKHHNNAFLSKTEDEHTLKLSGAKEISHKTSDITEDISPKSSYARGVKTKHDKTIFSNDYDISHEVVKTDAFKGNVLGAPSKSTKELYTGELIEGLHTNEPISRVYSIKSTKGIKSSESTKELTLRKSIKGSHSSESIKGLKSSETKREVYFKESFQGLYSFKTRRSEDNRIADARQHRESISTDTEKTSANVSIVDITRPQENTLYEDDVASEKDEEASEKDEEAIESFFAYNAVGETPLLKEERVTVHIGYWDEYAKAEIVKWRLSSEVYGTGRDIIFCLDISSSMKGNPLKRARTFVRKKIKEFQHADQTISVYDHVALVTFGGETKVQQHLTYEYYEVLTKLDRVRPGGPSPLYAGLKICEAVIQSSDSGDNSCPRHKGTLTQASAKTGYSMLHVIGDKTTTAPSTDSRDIVYVISDGKATPSSFIKGPDACTEGEQREEQDRVVDLCKDLQKKYHFAIVAVYVGDTKPNSWAVYDDVLISTDLGLKVKDESKDKTAVPNVVPDPDKPYLELGTRVRRKGQRLCGTVTKLYSDDEESLSGIRITWDEVNPEIGTEKEDIEEALFDSIEVVDQPRELNGTLIAVGCRVIRGRDWDFKDPDNLSKHRGTVLKVRDSGIVDVVWDDGHVSDHRFGLDGLFEVEIEQPDHKETVSMSDANGAETSKHSQYQTAGAPFMWRWKDSGGVWQTYPDAINKAIEVSYCTNERGTITINLDDKRYNIIFSRMVQVDVDTKEKYPVARR